MRIDADAGADPDEEVVTYLDGVAASAAALARGLRTYPDDEIAFLDAVAEVKRRESACDEQLQTLQVALGRRGDPELLRLFLLLDEVPNRAETVLRTLAATRPAVPESVLVDLRRMGDLTVSTTERIRGVAADYALDATDADVEGEVLDVRVLEGQCDELKYDVLDRLTHVDDPARTVLLALVRDLDGVPDAVEDAADHLLYLSSGD